MPIELNFEDITPSAPGTKNDMMSQPVGGGVPGSGIINWIDQLNALLDRINQMLVNYKEIRNNMQSEQRQTTPFQSVPNMNYIAPPTGHPPAPQPVAPSFDLNAALVEKAREIVRHLCGQGFQDKTIENVFDSFKHIKIGQLAGLLGVKDDTRPE